MTHKPLCNIWLASCVPDGGAYRFSVGEDGALTQNRFIPMPSPTWLEKTGNTLLAVLRAPWEGKSESAVAGFDAESGELTFPFVSTRGKVACHLAADGKDVYAANYTSGSLIRLPDGLVVHEGKGVNPERQECPHVHSVVFSQDGKSILSCDLGLDTVFVYDRELKEISRANVPDGSGPRHLVFSKDGKFVYVVNEMGASVSVFAFADGNLSLIRTVPMLAEVEAKESSRKDGQGAAIRLTKDGKRLYVTERLTNCIVVFNVNGAELTEIGRYDAYGDGPRDFLLIADDRLAVCANQWSGNAVVFSVTESGGLSYRSEVPLPQVLAILEEVNS